MFESSRTRSDADAEALEKTQNDLRTVLEELHRQGPGTTAADALEAARREAERARTMPQHLQDLAPDDLPEESRGVITREIQFFRERAAKREADKRAAADLASKNQAAQLARNESQSLQQSPRDSRDRDMPPREERRDDNRPRGRQSAFGPDAQNFGKNQRAGGKSQRQWGQQSTDSPGFVRSNGTGITDQYDSRDSRDFRESGRDSRRESELTDEDQERIRQDRIAREKEQAFREKERRWENRERNRVAGQEREKQRELGLQRDEDAQRASMASKLAEWDDEAEQDRAKELFYVDRYIFKAGRSLVR